MSSFLYISGDVVNGALKACDDGHVIYGLSSVYDKRAFPKSSTLWGLDSQRRERWQISGVQWTGPNASAGVVPPSRNGSRRVSHSWCCVRLLTTPSSHSDAPLYL